VLAVSVTQFSMV